MKVTWKIANLKRDNTTGLVSEISYLILFDLDGQTVHHFETLPIQGSENDSNFIPFENLTEDLVISWVHDLLGVDKISEIEQRSKLLLDEKILRNSQSTTTEGKPWS
jgi:hypothetical protein